MDFKAEFDKTAVLDFLKNRFLPDDFRPHSEPVKFSQLSFTPDRIKEIEYIGESPSLDLKLYAIRHDSENDPRVMLSRETFRVMSNLGAQRALIIFYSANSGNYRLSLATIELSLKGARTKREYSNPRRYSFFLGPDAKTHTPEQFLSKKVSDFDDLLKRFSIEVVNKEFYNEIAVLFTKLVGGRRKVKARVENFETPLLKLPSTVDKLKMQEFAVRLIGRVVFCWFLKKKKSENGVSLIPENILSLAAVRKRAASGDSYYHAILENLFFQVLNKPQKERYREFQKEPYNDTPFLNGGLFEPHNDDFYEYEPVTRCSKFIGTLKIPNDWFAELFGVLETYNFTIDENTSVDVDLAVDPEMLGRIFENLLAEINPETGETARKSTGSYYTPRQIVEYMVDESLKEYLKTKTAVAEEKLSGLLSYSDTEIELTGDEREKIVSALDGIKVLDPACGSGAFPMGVLHKIVLVLQKVDPDSRKWIAKLLDGIPDPGVKELIRKKLENDPGLNNYARKLGIIRKSIYGVDIQPIAVELSKLRFFLSLVVDEKVNENEENRGIEPLPNLEFKFVCANTLIGLPQLEAELFDDVTDIERLRKLRDEYFTSSGTTKLKVENEFLATQKKMLMRSLGWGKPDTRAMKLSQWEPFKDKSSGWFDPDWMFGLKDGFDIVIGNPPYVGFHGVDKEYKAKLKNIYSSANGKFDIYLLFIEKSLYLLQEEGFFTFICPTSFAKRDHGRDLRELLRRNVSLNELVDFEHDQVFDQATNYTGVFSFTKLTPSSNHKLRYRCGLADNGALISQNSLSSDIWVFKDSQSSALIEKIKSEVRLEEIANISEGIVTGLNDLYLRKTDTIRQDKFEAEYFVLAYRGREIGKYYLKYPTESVFYPYKLDEGHTVPVDEVTLKEKSPNFYKFLHGHLSQINGRGYFKKSTKKWYELWNQRKLHNFLPEKILTPELSDRNRFSLAAPKTFYGDTACGIVLKEDRSREIDMRYLLAILNSKLIEWFYKSTTVPKAGGFFIYKVMFLKDVPIKIAPLSQQKIFIDSVKEILSLASESDFVDNATKQSQFKKYLQEIDRLVYKLYGLTPEEIKIVEQSVK